jgi:hypothetical protein
MEMAYLTASIPLMKKPPKLQTLLVTIEDPKPRREAMPWEQQLVAVKSMFKRK